MTRQMITWHPAPGAMNRRYLGLYSLTLLFEGPYNVMAWDFPFVLLNVARAFLLTEGLLYTQPDNPYETKLLNRHRQALFHCLAVFAPLFFGEVIVSRAAGKT